MDEGGGALAEVTVGVVESILDPIRPAIAAMSGQVKVLSAVNGVVALIVYPNVPDACSGIKIAFSGP